MSVSPGTAKQRRWLSEVEMKTHMPPHRSLWLGPQFTFNVRQPGSLLLPLLLLLLLLW